jgi:hypothetical protein
MDVELNPEKYGKIESSIPVLMLTQTAFIEAMAARIRQKGATGTLEGFFGSFLFQKQVEPAALALGPVRTKPRRTYDVINDTFTPEGDHTLVLLSRILLEKDDPRRSDLLRSLIEFGSESGLFEKIGVRRLGTKPSDPFKVLVKAGGPSVTIRDVGYGVSQALPLIIQCVLAEGTNPLLLQQPEVHLHPRGQAALGTFFARLVEKKTKSFVIETHSDYLIDRVRLEIASGTIPAEKVLILFFEKKGMKTKVHPIAIDQAGDLVNTPKSYRAFFLKEGLRLLERKNA